MSQTNKIFISILNRIRTNNQTEDDLNYLNQNCIRNAPNDPTFPYLFFWNRDVALYKNKMLSVVRGDEIVIDAIDYEEENHGNIPSHAHIATLPSQIVLKFNMLVKIYAGSYDSQDGLVNGADGIIKAYVKLDNFDVIWIKFYDECIGCRQAHRFSFLYSQQICKYWTPILRTTKPVSVLEKIGKLKIRKQFPIQLACARTIHRLQGLTLDNLAFDPLRIHHHGLVYAALSCVRNIESLYLLSPLKNENFQIKHNFS